MNIDIALLSTALVTLASGLQSNPIGGIIMLAGIGLYLWHSK